MNFESWDLVESGGGILVEALQLKQFVVRRLGNGVWCGLAGWYTGHGKSRRQAKGVGWPLMQDLTLCFIREEGSPLVFAFCGHRRFLRARVKIGRDARYDTPRIFPTKQTEIFLCGEDLSSSEFTQQSMMPVGVPLQECAYIAMPLLY